MQQTASQLYIQMIQQAFQTAGGDYAALNARLFGDSPKETHRSKDIRIDTQDISTIWQAVHTELDDPLFALRIGETIHPSDYGILGYVWMNCSTLLECFNSVVEFKKLMNDAFEASYAIKGNEYIYTVYLDELDREQSAPFINLDIASIFFMGRFLVGPRNSKKILFNQVNLQQAHDDELKAGIEEILGCPVAMGQPHNQIIIGLDILELPVHAPNATVQKMMLNKVKKLASLSYPQQSTSKRVVDFITDNMAGKLPSADTTAKHLGMSLSSLKRSLKEEDETFQKLVDKQRFHHAGIMLAEKKLSVCEISFLLGYSNSSSFTRSFKTWSGKSPKQYRNAVSS